MIISADMQSGGCTRGVLVPVGVLVVLGVLVALGVLREWWFG